MRTIPAAELAPGMIQVQVEDVGLVWVDAAEMKLFEDYRHPPFDTEVREFLETHIQKPLAEVQFMTLDEWEDGFRRDTNPEREMAVWSRIAERLGEFSEAEELNLEQKKECLAVMLHSSSGETNPETVLEVVSVKAMTRDQAHRAIATFYRND